MELANLGTNLTMFREHLQLFALLLFALPMFSFVSIRFWVAGRAAKVQRTTNWFVPTDLDSEAARLHYAMRRDSLSLSRQLAREPRHTEVVTRFK